MKFQEIYRNCKTQVQETLRSWWITDSMSDVEKQFIEKYIENYISKVNGDNIVVQSMYPWESTSGQEAMDAMARVEPLWREKFTPFKHQYKAWKTLLDDNRSIVVTTGTGSGKTECFLVPVIKDLAERANNRRVDDPHPVEALFLYPLNALMNDQKERIDKFLFNLEDHGEKVSFAVYNGNTPEDMSDEGADAAQSVAWSLAESTAEKAEGWAGLVDPVLHERFTRKSIRNDGASILITNPSMLEYMLLRQKDDPIFKRSKGQLKWIVIDETHTFTGAAAAELAYLLKRVMNAFDVKSDQVRFVTSSATISGPSGRDDLKKFISDISGQKPSDIIEVISGSRTLTRISGSTSLPVTLDEVRSIEDCLYATGQDNYVTLNSLVKSGATVEEKLAILDSLTDNSMPMRAKVHFFFPALDKGVECRLGDCNDLLPMFVCSECGHLVIAAEIDSDGKLIPYESKTEIRDVFDQEEDLEDVDLSEDVDDGTVADSTPSRERLITLLDSSSDKYYSTQASVENGKLIPDMSGQYSYSVGHVCPCCQKDSKKANKLNYEGNEASDNMRDFLRKLTCPPSFIGRIIAPSLLDQMIENGAHLPHKGQQYISFVDSRQGCSKATLSQNVEVEREWVYSRLFEALNNLPSSKNYLSWKEVADILMNQTSGEFGLLYDVYDTSKQAMPGGADIKRAFIGNVSVQDFKKRRYVHSIMFYALSNRPKNANSPETMGLFRTYYPKLESINAPDKFKDVISDEQWRNLLKIYLDFDVRNNGSFYLRHDEQGYFRGNDVDAFVDIFDLSRFKYSNEKRRPRFKPTAKSRVYTMIKQACPSLDIDAVVDALWDDLTTGNNPILVNRGARIKPNAVRNGNMVAYRNQRWVPFDRDGYYMNLYDMCFKLYDVAYLCPETNRPLDVCFMDLTPYRTKGEGYKKVEGGHQWDKLPSGYDRTYPSLQTWHSNNRTAIHHLWDQRLYRYYSIPQVFVQKEHTAQLNLQEARDYLVQFKDLHTINILACSTTMEMGVDVGSLELVVMNNVPPGAANYKQRAGRSGRMEQNRSASIALCGQDVHSRNVCKEPLRLINKSIAAPYVDFDSKVIMQRQINAYVFKSVVRHVGFGENGTNLMDFFTDYTFGRETTPQGDIKVRYDRVIDDNGHGKHINL